MSDFGERLVLSYLHYTERLWWSICMSDLYGRLFGERLEYAVFLFQVPSSRPPKSRWAKSLSKVAPQSRSYKSLIQIAHTNRSPKSVSSRTPPCPPIKSSSSLYKLADTAFRNWARTCIAASILLSCENFFSPHIPPSLPFRLFKCPLCTVHFVPTYSNFLFLELVLPIVYPDFGSFYLYFFAFLLLFVLLLLLLLQQHIFSPASSFPSLPQ